MIANNLIAGNSSTECSAAYQYGAIFGTMSNNTIAYNYNSSGSGVIDMEGFDDYDFNNNIFAYNRGYGIREIYHRTPTTNAILKNNLFYKNSSGAYYDYNSKTVIDTESGLNSLHPPGTNKENIIRNPGFRGGMDGTWTLDPLFDDLKRQTTLTDANAKWQVNELAGKFVNPKLDEPLQFYIVENTAFSLTVWGDLSDKCTSVSLYRIFDYHLANGSPAIDRGDPSLAPDDDFEGNPRPGDDAMADIGCDETESSFSSHPPSCQLYTPSGMQSGEVPIYYKLIDAESNLCDIVVEYSTDGGSSFHIALEGFGSHGTSSLISSPEGVERLFVWDSVSQGLIGVCDQVVIRITPADFEVGKAGATGPFSLLNKPPNQIDEYYFIEDEEGWTSVTLPKVFTPPSFRYLNGALEISSTDNINTYGFWQSPLEGFPTEPGELYRARFMLSTDVTERYRVPHIRLRSGSTHNQKNHMLEISSNMYGEYSPTREPRPYDLYITPSMKDASSPGQCANEMLFFDLVNIGSMDAAKGTVRLHSVEVFRIDTSSLVKRSTERHWDFEDNKSTGWRTLSIPEYYTSPGFTCANGALCSTGKDENTYGSWETDYEQLDVKSARLYRAGVIVSSSEGDQSRVPCFRLRFNTEICQSDTVLEVSSLSDGANSPVPGGSVYDLYYVPPQHIQGTLLDALILSFDMKSFDKKDSCLSTLRLEEAIVETFEIPD